MNRLMSPPNPPVTTRRWLSGLAVTVATIVSYLAFWHLSPALTFIIGCVAFVGLCVAAWIHGGQES